MNEYDVWSLESIFQDFTPEKSLEFWCEELKWWKDAHRFNHSLPPLRLPISRNMIRMCVSRIRHWRNK